uniref:Myosin light chain kinase n=1 Tax=Gallus gallus TaxID=9031 RepID=Q7LZ16_CHICK
RGPAPAGVKDTPLSPH